MILSEAFALGAVKNLARPAFHFLGKDIPYSELKTKIGRLSYLYQKELGQGEFRFGLLGSSSPALASTFLALTNLRVLCVPIPVGLSPEELSDWIKSAQLTHLGVTSDLLASVRQTLQGLSIHIPLVEIEKKSGGEYDPVYSPPPDHPPTDNDPILLLRTSGSTGKPKFLVFNHKNVISALTAARLSQKITPNDRVLSLIPLTHAVGFVQGLLVPLFSGATCVLDHGLQGKEFLEFFLSSRINRLIATAPLIRKLILVCRNESFTLPGLKRVIIAQGSLSAELRKIFSLLKVQVTELYGQVESSWSIAAESPLEDVSEARDHAIFVAAPGVKVKVVDEQGDEIVGPGPKVGTLCLSGPMVFQEIWANEPDAKAETKKRIRGTWLYAGDIAELKENGDRWEWAYLGRKTEILVSGEAPKHSYDRPGPIESKLRSVAGVDDAAVFVAVSQRGQSVWAAAVVRGSQRPVVSEVQIKEVAPELAAVFFVDSIPHDAGGSPLRTKLAQQYAGVIP